MIAKLQLPPAAVLEKIKVAAPPPRFPRGYFDALMTPTRELLDRGLKLAQAADWWVEQNVIPPGFRQRFMDAMHGRLSRLRHKKKAGPEVVAWKASLAYDSVHAVGNGTAALCGASTARWLNATSTANRCCRCIGVARKLGLTVRE